MSTTLTRDELLVILCEECAEVIQAATKCLRFGYSVTGPGDYGRNDHVLAHEVGQLNAIVDALELSLPRIIQAYDRKIEKAEEAKRMYGAAR